MQYECSSSNVQETVIKEKSGLEKINLRNQEFSIVDDCENELFKNKVNNDSIICNIDSDNANRYIITKLNHIFLMLEKIMAATFI